MNYKKMLMTLGMVAAFAVSAITPTYAAEAGVVEVPFAFQYLKSDMPAGKYVFRYSESPSALIMTNVETSRSFQVAVRAGYNRQKPLKLVFAQGHVLKPIQ